MTETKQIQLWDDDRLVSVKSRCGTEYKIYDDGYGPLWILRDSMGIVGVVRARTWLDAFSCAEDELYPEPTETMEEIVREYGENWSDDACWQEQYGFRPSGGIYVKDLNGDALDPLTAAMVDAWELTVTIEPFAWERMRTEERIDWCSAHRVSIFAARRDEVPVVTHHG